MRAATCALAALLALASTAAAGETESTFAIRFESDESAALQALESLSMTVSRAWQTLEEPPTWDAAQDGVYETVRRGADYRVKSPLPGEATVTVTIAPADTVPSESRSAQALAEALLARVRLDADARVDAWRARALSSPRSAVEAANARLSLADMRATTHRTKWGDVATEHRMTSDRLQEAAADLARTRIDLAVATSRLEAARKGAERAAEADEIRRRADEFERRLESESWDDPAKAEALRREIGVLRKLLADAERNSPPLLESRRMVFDLEVDVVGLEARKVALQPEIAELRARVVELLGAAAESRVIEAQLNAARSTFTEKQDDVRELEIRLGAAGVAVVTPPTPGAIRKR